MSEAGSDGRMSLLLRILVWVCLIGEGLWCFAALSIAGPSAPTALYTLCALWVLLLVGGIIVRTKPVIGLIFAMCNLIGCVSIESVPGGVDHRWLYALYSHTVDLVLVLLFAGLFLLQHRKRKHSMTQQAKH